MTDVLVRLTTPSSGAAASGWVPADEVAAVGHLVCRPYAPDLDGARQHLKGPDRLLLPASMPPVRLEGGEALLHLAPTGAGWCWQIIERTPRGKTRYVLVPDSVATLDYADLIDVDPATLDPAAEPEAAWWAAVGGIGGDIGQAVADYLTANPPEVGGLDTLTDVDTTGQVEGDVLTLGPLGEWGPAAVPAPDMSGYVPTTDGRLSDARTPLAHKASHATGGTDALTPGDIGAQPAGSYAATSHTHTLDATTDTATRLALTPDERTKLTNTSGTNTGDQVLPTWTTLSGKPAVIAAGATQADARTAIGAGTSSLVIGTGAGDAKAGNYSPPDATASVKGIMQLAGDLGGTAAAPTVPGLAGKADASHNHAASQISDSTATGRMLITAATATAARTAISAAPALGSDDNYVTDAEKAALHSHSNKTALDAVSGTNTGDQDLSGYALAAQTIKAQTGTSYTLQASDAGKLVTLTNAAAITLTVPASTFTAGQRVDCLVLGAGMVTATAGPGLTLNGTPTLVSRAQWSAFTVLFTSATTAVVVGDLASA